MCEKHKFGVQKGIPHEFQNRALELLSTDVKQGNSRGTFSEAMI